MNDRSAPTPPPADEADRLAREVAAARATLAALERDIAFARSDAGLAALVALSDEVARLQRENSRALREADTAAAALEVAVRAAEVDPLTQLPNRSLLLDRLHHNLALARRRRGRLAVLFVDLDAFKAINDRLGHAVGDLVLQHVAQCLNAAVRASDTVSRLGGDEFVLVLSEVQHAADAQAVADKVTASLAAPCHLGGHTLQLAASIGTALYPDDGSTPDTLLQRADQRMYAAKRRHAADGPPRT